MSEPLKVAANATKKANEQVKKLKEQTERYKESIANAQKKIKEAEGRVNQLSKSFLSNKKQIEKAKETIKKYSDTTGLSEKQMEAYKKRVAEANIKLKSLINAQKSNRKELKLANATMEAYSKIVNKNNEQLRKAREQISEYSKKIAETNKRVDEAKKKAQDWGKSIISSIDGAIKKVAKMGVAFGSISGTFAVTKGFGEAMDMEGYKMQLVTATKDTQKAGELMSNAIKFANSTPFETGEVVEATAKMEAYGISSQRWLKDVADMAGATNKSIDQATEAMADAVMGEWERMKEFGIKKEVVIAAAAKKYGDKIIKGKGNEAKKQELIAKTLQEVMQAKFKGGAEKQAKTLKGLWSTVTGVTKSSLAKIVGMTEDGTIRQGSLYELLKKQIERVVTVLNKWQEDGTIERIGEKVTEAVSRMISFFKSLFEFVKRHQTLIKTVLIFASSIYVAIKVVAILKIALMALSVVVGILSGTIALTPFGWLVIAITAVIAGACLLWQHFSAVIEVFKSVFNWVKSLLERFGALGFLLGGPFLAPVMNLIKQFDVLKKAGEKVWGIIKKVFGFKGKNEVETKENKEVKINEKKGKKLENETIKEENKSGKKNIVGERQQLKIEKEYHLNKEKIIKENVTKQEKIKNTFKKETVKGIGVTNLNDIKQNNVFKNQNFRELSMNAKPQKVEKNIHIEINGDMYGFEDFKEKVAEAVVKIYDQEGANVVG